MANKKNRDKKITIDKRLSKKDDEILYAFLATFLSIIGVLIAVIVRRNNKYIMYYTKQSIVIFFIIAAAGVFGRMITILPIIGRIINTGLVIISLLLWLVSWIYALTGKEKIIPIVSELAEKIHM